MVQRQKEMTSPPVERKDNCECLEMLRWTEAISSTNTAPASLPAPSYSLTDFLLWVIVCSYVSFCLWKCVCVYLRVYITMHTVSIPFFVSAHKIAVCDFVLEAC